MHKIHNNIIYSPNFIPIQNIHNYQTRLSQGINYFQTFNRVNLGQTTYSSQGIKVWREIPNDLKKLPFSTFKVKLKN